jgi:hypothetical protein
MPPLSGASLRAVMADKQIPSVTVFEASNQQLTPTLGVLVAIDVTKARNEVLVESPATCAGVV